MGQVIVGGYNDAVAGAATEYNSLMGGYTWNATEINRYQCMPAAGTIKDLFVEVSAVPGVGATLIFTLMKNAVAQALTCTVAADGTTASDVDPAHAVSFVAGDTVSIRCTYTGAPSTPTAAWHTTFTPTTANETILLLNVPAVTANEIYCTIAGRSAGGSATEVNHKTPISTAGTLKDLYVKLGADPGTDPDAYVFTLRQDTGGGSADTTLTCTIVADNTTGNDTVHDIDVAAGDLFTMSIDPGATTPATASPCAIGMVFVPDVAGESLIIGGNINASNTADIVYAHLGSDGLAWTTTEASALSLIGATTLQKLYVYTSTAPGAAKSYTYSLRVEGAASTLTCVVTGAATQAANDTTHTKATANGDSCGMEVTPAGTPAVMRTHWCVVGYISASTLTLRPNVDVSVILTRSAGDDNYALVDEAVVNDGDYVYNDYFESWRTDIYGLPNHTSETGTISNVRIYCRMKAMIGQSGNYGKTVIRTHATDYESTKSITGTWATYYTDYATNPFTGVAWTWDEIDALEGGVSLWTDGADIIGGCSWVYVEVTYTTSQTYEVSASEGLKAGDAITTQVSFQSIATDGMKGGDAPGSLGVLISSGIDGIKAGDAPSTNTSVYSIAADGIKLSDLLAIFKAYQALAVDGIKVGDIVSTIFNPLLTVLDGIKLADTIATLASLQSSGTDGAKFGDAPVPSVTFQSIAADGIKLADAPVVILSYTFTVADGIKLSDIPQGGLSYNILASDGVKIGELIIALAGQKISITLAMNERAKTLLMQDRTKTIVMRDTTYTIPMRNRSFTIPMQDRTKTLVMERQ